MNEKNYKFIHVYFKAPTLGLLLESENEDEVVEKLRFKIVKQLTEMSLKQFKKFCDIEYRNVEDYVVKGSGPTHTY